VRGAPRLANRSAPKIAFIATIGRLSIATIKDWRSDMKARESEMPGEPQWDSYFNPS